MDVFRALQVSAEDLGFERARKQSVTYGADGGAYLFDKARQSVSRVACLGVGGDALMMQPNTYTFIYILDVTCVSSTNKHLIHSRLAFFPNIFYAFGFFI